MRPGVRRWRDLFAGNQSGQKPDRKGGQLGERESNHNGTKTRSKNLEGFVTLCLRGEEF